MIHRRRWAGRWCVAGWLAGAIAIPAGGGSTYLAAAEPASVDSVSTTRFGLGSSLESAAADSVAPGGWLAPGPSRVRWGLLGSAVGVVGGVTLALLVKSEADERYDLYLRTADPETAAEIFDEAERYDRAALIGFGIAEISFVAMVYFLARSGDRDLVPIEGEPLLRIRDHGAEVGVRFNP